MTTMTVEIEKSEVESLRTNLQNVESSLAKLLSGVAETSKGKAGSKGKETANNEEEAQKRKTPHRGLPDEVFSVIDTEIGDGKFSTDLLYQLSRNAGVDIDKSQMNNSIQALVKEGKIEVFSGGRGRRVAIYQRVQKTKTE